jgi:hypothetical protein
MRLAFILRATSRFYEDLLGHHVAHAACDLAEHVAKSKLCEEDAHRCASAMPYIAGYLLSATEGLSPDPRQAGGHPEGVFRRRATGPFWS